MEFRAYEPQLEVRSLSKRLLCGVVVPFGVDQTVDDQPERFDPRAFEHQYRAASRVSLLSLHSTHPGHMPLGRATELRGEHAGLYGEFRVAPGVLGDHYLELVRDGALHQWSIGFRPERTTHDRGVTVYLKATVFETALVPEGAYGELAAVAAVRAAPIPKLRRDELLARMPKPRFPM